MGVEIAHSYAGWGFSELFELVETEVPPPPGTIELATIPTEYFEVTA